MKTYVIIHEEPNPDDNRDFIMLDIPKDLKLRFQIMIEDLIGNMDDCYYRELTTDE